MENRDNIEQLWDKIINNTNKQINYQFQFCVMIKGRYYRVCIGRVTENQNNKTKIKHKKWTDATRIIYFNATVNLCFLGWFGWRCSDAGFRNENRHTCTLKHTTDDNIFTIVLSQQRNRSFCASGTAWSQNDVVLRVQEGVIFVAERWL